MIPGTAAESRLRPGPFSYPRGREKAGSAAARRAVPCPAGVSCWMRRAGDGGVGWRGGLSGTARGALQPKDVNGLRGVFERHRPLSASSAAQPSPSSTLCW